MAFLRFTRDKRGYEYFYLVQPSQKRGRSTARVLYWYRTPPNVKVGREPFDDHVRRELEKENPDVVFDWRKILETPIPSADAEMWRERRRAERAAKALRRVETRESVAVEAEPAIDADAGTEQEPDAPVHVLEAAAAAAPIDAAIPPDLSAPGSSNEGVDASKDLRTVGSGESSHRKRRRRRRGRGRPGPQGSGGGGQVGSG